jgi:serine/threonine-protein kinase
MVVDVKGMSRPTLARPQPTVADGSSAPGPAASRPPLGRWLAFAAVVAVAFAVGGLAGRVTPRQRQAWVSFGAAVPRRAQVELDGQRVSVPADGRLLVAPGEHVLTVVLPKGARREYTFSVRPNENVVLLSPRRAAGSPEEGAEDREP